MTTNDVTGPASAPLTRPDGEPAERLAVLPQPPGALRLRSHLLDGLPGSPERLPQLLDGPPGSPDRLPPLLDGPPGSIDGLPQSLAELDFVIVDVETTGWLPEEAGIIEIGAVRVSGSRIQAQFCTLVNPGRPVPADITALTGITDAMVGLAPPISVAMPRFLAFASDCLLTAHNAAFDISFLSAACGGAGISWPAFPVLDTVALARLVLGTAAEVPDCKLRTLASFFATKTLPCHRALPDAMATAEVLQSLLRRLAIAGVRTLAELRAG